MARTPTVYDVAERAGVSIATVSFAFRRPDRIRPATRDAVLTAARELGYVPNVSARGLAHGRTGALGLYSFDFLLEAPDAANDDGDARAFPLYVDEVQRGVELACWRRGYALMIGGNLGEASGDVVTDIAGRVDGLAVFPRTVAPEVLQHIARRIPVVEVSEPAHDDGLSHVTVDNVGGMRALTQHMIDVHGARDLVFVGSTEGSDAAARLKGLRAALRAAKLPAPRRVASVAEAVATASDRPDAWMCSTDVEALALIDALTAAGVRVPKDVAVTGFDGIIAGALSTPALTTVRQPMQLLGSTVVDVLAAQIDAKRPSQVSKQLPVSLLVRQSCGCA